jgi:acyl-CoA synthetase (NDP forming)
MADVDFIDLLEYLENDDNTRVIGLYIEGYPKAGELIDLMRRIALKKPIVVLKVGRTSRGAIAANSHTGSLAGEDRVYDSVFRQYGIIRVNSIDELMDTLQAFDRLPIPEGNRLFLLSQAGGPGIFCMDTLSQFEFIDFSIIGKKSRERLRELLPPMASFCKPEGYADISASATVQHHTDALEILMDDSEVDGVLMITVVPTFLPKKELAEGLVSTYKRIKKHKNKPLFPVIMAGNWVKDIREIIEENGIPTFETPDRAARVAANMIKYSLFFKKHSAERQV